MRLYNVCKHTIVVNFLIGMSILPVNIDMTLCCGESGSSIMGEESKECLNVLQYKCLDAWVTNEEGQGSIGWLA